MLQRCGGAAAPRNLSCSARARGIALGVLLLSLTGLAPASAHDLPRLAGNAAAACAPTQFGTVVEAAAFVRNLEFRPVLLTHALLIVETKRAGDGFFRRKAVDNLLLSSWNHGFDPVLQPGEKRVGRVELLVPSDTLFVRSILLVHVFGESFFRFAVDVDRCDLFGSGGH
jgi:hypothetical protein